VLLQLNLFVGIAKVLLENRRKRVMVRLAGVNHSFLTTSKIAPPPDKNPSGVSAAAFIVELWRKRGEMIMKAAVLRNLIV